jgi:hypothetical protein
MWPNLVHVSRPMGTAQVLPPPMRLRRQIGRPNMDLLDPLTAARLLFLGNPLNFDLYC